MLFFSVELDVAYCEFSLAALQCQVARQRQPSQGHTDWLCESVSVKSKVVKSRVQLA